jgi:hypothetical protein
MASIPVYILAAAALQPRVQVDSNWAAANWNDRGACWATASWKDMGAWPFRKQHFVMLPSHPRASTILAPPQGGVLM